MTDSVNTNPSIIWAQDKNYIFLTIEIENIREQNIEYYNDKIIFQGSSINNNYNVIIDLLNEIETDKCNWNIKPNCVKITIKKVKNLFWKRLTKHKQNNIKIDWSKWIVEDDSDIDSDEENEMVSNFNDFKKNIPSEILEKDFKELFSPDEELTDDSNSESENYDASGEMSSSIVEELGNIELDNTELDNTELDNTESDNTELDNRIKELDLEVLDEEELNNVELK